MSTIRNPQQTAIPIDFKISNGSIGGTDIDFVLEFNDRFLILVEVKRGNADIPVGQRLLLERIADAWRASGRRAVVIHASWNELTDDGFINLRNAKVRKIYNEAGEWTDVPNTQRDFVPFLNIIGHWWKCRKCRF